MPLLKKVLAQIESEDGWISLGLLGHRVASIASDFDSRTYGYRKLSDLVRKAGAFDVDQPEGGALRVRLKAERPMRRATSLKRSSPLTLEA